MPFIGAVWHDLDSCRCSRLATTKLNTLDTDSETYHLHNISLRACSWFSKPRLMLNNFDIKDMVNVSRFPSELLQTTARSWNWVANTSYFHGLHTVACVSDILCYLSVNATNFIFLYLEQHVSTLEGHHQVLQIIYLQLLICNATFALHLFLIDP
jgi:hypothetical protein